MGCGLRKAGVCFWKEWYILHCRRSVPLFVVGILYVAAGYGVLNAFHSMPNKGPGSL
jgi:hypothetical protein